MENRIEKLEKDVQYLVKRVKELNDEIVILKGDGLEEGIQKELAQVYKEKSNQMMNFLRNATIEDSKRFIENYIEGVHTIDGYGIITYKVDFKVKKNKRSVEAVLLNGTSGLVHKRLLVKCHPDDVFNEHIGKAIALGRILGLDVSIFEDIVQPDEVVVGMVVASHDNSTHEWKIKQINNYTLELEIVKSKNSGFVGKCTDAELNSIDDWVIIIDDTDAEYNFNK